MPISPLASAKGVTLALAIAPLLSQAAHAQSTWTVRQDGLGDFQLIGDALRSQSVVNGDTILIYPGTYAEGRLLIDKTLRIRGFGGHRETKLVDSPITVLTPFPGEVILEDLTLRESTDPLLQMAVTLTADHTRRLTVIDCVFQLAPIGCLTRGLAEFRNCLFQNLSVFGIEAESSFVGLPSQVTLNQSTLVDCGTLGGGTAALYWSNPVDTLVNSSIFDNQTDWNGTAPPLTVTYSRMNDVGGPWAGIGCTNSNPRLVTGSDGLTYLSHIATGDPLNSPCIDAGDPGAALFGSTRKDFERDINTIDMGFHAITTRVDLDTDDDGISDQDESVVFGTDPFRFDTDADGLSDGLEVGLTTGTPETDPFFFVPDSDPNTTTDPLNPDSDTGGIPDGVEDHDGNGAVDTWDTDPANRSDDRFSAYFSNLSPGQLALVEVWNATPNEALIPAYSVSGPGPSSSGIGILIDLTRPIHVLDPMLSDSDGRARASLTRIPLGVPLGTPVWLQVIEVPIASGAPPQKSNPVLLPIGAF